MKRAHLAALVVATVLAAAGCKSAKVSQATGSDFVTDAGRLQAVTYVTPEEFNRMTEEERARLHASIGARVEWTTDKPKPEAVKISDLDKAMKAP